MFGEKLRKLREKAGLTQKELAEMLGHSSNSYISDIEKGVFLPSKEKLRKIAKALGVPFKELEDMLFEEKLKELGIEEKELLELFREIPRMPKEDKEAIVKAYLKIKRRKQNGVDNQKSE